MIGVLRRIETIAAPIVAGNRPRINRFRMWLAAASDRNSNPIRPTVLAALERSADDDDFRQTSADPRQILPRTARLRRWPRESGRQLSLSVGNGHSDDSGWHEPSDQSNRSTAVLFVLLREGPNPGSIPISGTGAEQRRTRTITASAAREINRDSPMEPRSDFLCPPPLSAEPDEKRQPRPSSA